MKRTWRLTPLPTWFHPIWTVDLQHAKIWSCVAEIVIRKISCYCYCLMMLQKRSELCMLRIIDSTGTQNLLHLLEKSPETKPCYILMPRAVRNPNENLTAKLRSEGPLALWRRSDKNIRKSFDGDKTSQETKHDECHCQQSQLLSQCLCSGYWNCSWGSNPLEPLAPSALIFDRNCAIHNMPPLSVLQIWGQHPGA